MQYTNDGDIWTDWSDDNADRDEPTRLAALRELIFEEAKRWVAAAEITAEWANKKLATLGITERILREVPYAFEAPVTAVMDLRVYATSRTHAREKLAELLATNGGGMVKRISSAGDVADAALVSGPEDAPTEVADDAPTTVDATLMKLRETILLGNIAGPRFNCEVGANRVLASFGLDPIPERKWFTVAMPVEGVMTTTIEAYDEQSAKRVGGWRWDNNRSGFGLDSVTDSGPMDVHAANTYL